MTDSAQAWAEAFTAAQSEFPHITKDKTAEIPTKSGGKYSYKYADLPTILEQVNPVLAAHGLSVAQSVVSNGVGVGVSTRIFHKQGHVEEFGPVYLPAGEDARSAGSAITYSRRYSLCGALGIATEEDDDGAAASRPTKPVSQSLDSEKAGIVVDGTEPHCPACLAVNGEFVGVWDNRDKEKGPKWKCKNKPEDCAGAEPDKNGKLWSWSGWDASWERSAQAWLDEHGEGEPVKEEPTPGEWLKAQGALFTSWSQDEKNQAYDAVKEELGVKRLSTREQAESIFAGMRDAYWTEFPDEAPF